MRRGERDVVAATIVAPADDPTVPDRQREIDSREEIALGTTILDRSRRARAQPVRSHERGEPVEVCGADRHGAFGVRRLSHVRTVGGRGEVLQLRSDEDVQPVAHDRAADREPDLRLLVRCASRCARSTQPVTATVDEERSLNVVRPGSRDGVHERAREIAVSDVVGREERLVLAHGVERDGSDPGGGARHAPAEGALRDAVDEEVVEANPMPPAEKPGLASEIFVESWGTRRTKS